jgi:hypothetical protein
VVPASIASFIQRKKGHERLAHSPDHRLPLWSSVSSRRSAGRRSPDPRPLLWSSASSGQTILGLNSSSKKRGRVLHTRRTYIFKKKRATLLCLFRVAVALPCVSGVVYLCRDAFFVVFSTATACCHWCPHIVLFYTILIALATACLQHCVRTLPIRD